jgi:hypothetical protein
MKSSLSRRALFAFAGLAARGSAEEKLPPVRAITKGPKFHWFGYYDKLQFDPTSRYVLGMESDFEGRQPEPSDTIGLGTIDLEDGDRWTTIAETRAWCWQQGCMLQWLPGSKTDIIFNDREDNRFVSRIVNVKTGKKRTLPGPIYAVSPDAKWAVSTDFSRLNDERPGYGYAGIPDKYKDVSAPSKTGIWRMNLETGQRDLIISVADAARIPHKLGDWKDSKQRFNHLLFSPDGARFAFLHRRNSGPNAETNRGRMFTANPDGSSLYVLDPNGVPSHYIWRDAKHILCFAPHPSHGRRFYLFKDQTEHTEVVGLNEMTQDGHCTYLSGGKWILNDTYPDKERKQHPYLFHVATRKRYPLGHFLSPASYTGPVRCDTHPRFSRDGRKVVIDSPHGGNGRQMYLIDIAEITAS